MQFCVRRCSATQRRSTAFVGTASVCRRASLCLSSVSTTTPRCNNCHCIHVASEVSTFVRSRDYNLTVRSLSRCYDFSHFAFFSDAIFTNVSRMLRNLVHINWHKRLPNLSAIDVWRLYAETSNIVTAFVHCVNTINHLHSLDRTYSHDLCIETRHA